MSDLPNEGPEINMGTWSLRFVRQREDSRKEFNQSR